MFYEVFLFLIIQMILIMECGRMTVTNTYQTIGAGDVPDVDVFMKAIELYLLWALVLDQVCKYSITYIYIVHLQMNSWPKDITALTVNTPYKTLFRYSEPIKNPLYSESLFEFHSKRQFWTRPMFASVARL